MTFFKLLKTIVDINRFPKKNRADRDRIIKKKQQDLLAYAQQHSTYYQQHLPENIKNWEDIPPTSKSEWMDHFDDIVTDKRITMEKIWHQYKTPLNDSEFSDQYAVVMTSGTSGTPIVMVQERELLIVDALIHLFRADKCILPVAPIVTDHACAMEKEQFVSAVHQFPFFNKLLNKFVLPMDCQNSPKTIVEELRVHKIKSIGGYTSQIRVIAEYCISNRLDLPIKLIICSGEMLTEADKLLMQKAFPKARVTSMYCCTEANNIATECEYGHLHINEDFVKIEPVDLDYHVLPYDTLSSQTLVTVYGNRVQPVIRYALGDKIVLHHGCPCGNPSDWVEISGRSNDLLYFEGDHGKKIGVAPMNLLVLMNGFFSDGLEKFRDYQIIQHPHNVVELRLDLIEPERKDCIFAEVKTGIEKYLQSLGISQVTITLSDNGPDVPAPGKKKKRVIACNIDE